MFVTAASMKFNDIGLLFMRALGHGLHSNFYGSILIAPLQFSAESNG